MHRLAADFSGGDLALLSSVDGALFAVEAEIQAAQERQGAASQAAE